METASPDSETSTADAVATRAVEANKSNGFMVDQL
jgi:hypothetical protein